MATNMMAGFSISSGAGTAGILVNNAGIVNLSGGILEEDPADWDRVVETQLNAVFLLSKIAARSMKERGGGKIINIASMYSYFGSALVPSRSAVRAPPPATLRTPKAPPARSGAERAGKSR